MQQQTPSLHVMISMSVDADYRVTLDKIKSTVIAFFGVDERKFCSVSRKHDVVVARTFFAVLCKRIIPTATLKSIGKEMGGRDHSTTISCLKRFRNYCDVDRKPKRYFENLRAKLLREEIPFPNDNRYIAPKPISERVNEIRAQEEIEKLEGEKFHLEDDAEERKTIHVPDNNGYSYKSKALG